MPEKFEGTSPPETTEISRERILEMSPRELVDYFTQLEERGELQQFLEKSADDDALVAMFSYWEKWLEKDHRKMVDTVVEAKKEMYPETSESLPLDLEKKFTPEELELIFSNLGAIQLTFGCSKGCPFCGFDAVPGVREQIPYSRLANLFRKYGKQIGKREPTLYWASEPSDYADRIGLVDKTYQDVHDLAVEYAGYSPHITSRETTDEGWLKFFGSESVKNARVSVYGKNQEEVQALSQKVHQFSINDAGVKNVWLVGGGEEHKKGLGLSLTGEKSQIGKRGIACQGGVLMTPRGLFNTVIVPISEKYPQGQIVVPLEKISTAEEIDKMLKEGAPLTELLRNTVVKEYYEDDIYNSAGCLKLVTKDKIFFIAFDGEYRITKIRSENADDVNDKSLMEIEDEMAPYHKITAEYREAPNKFKEFRIRMVPGEKRFVISAWRGYYWGPNIFILPDVARKKLGWGGLERIMRMEGMTEEEINRYCKDYLSMDGLVEGLGIEEAKRIAEQARSGGKNKIF